jgi:phage terminase Nu1 subunit (DNA packaging protein)
MTYPSYPVSSIAKLFDLTNRRVQQLAAEGIIPKSIKGNYELVGSVKGYIRYLRSNKEDSKSSISVERARLLKMQADNLEQDMKFRNKTLLAREEVKKEWISILGRCRSALLAIPNRLAYQVNAASTPAESAILMKNAIYEALAELAEDNPNGNDDIDQGNQERQDNENYSEQNPEI